MDLFADEENKEVIEKMLECFVDLADVLGPGIYANEGVLE